MGLPWSHLHTLWTCSYRKFPLKEVCGDIYNDNGSSSNVIYKHFYKQIPRQIQEGIKPRESYLISFVGHNVWPKGMITLSLTLIDYHDEKNGTQSIKFFLSPTHYQLEIKGIERLGNSENHVKHF